MYLSGYRVVVEKTERVEKSTRETLEILKMNKGKGLKITAPQEWSIGEELALFQELKKELDKNDYTVSHVPKEYTIVIESISSSLLDGLGSGFCPRYGRSGGDNFD